MIYENQWGMHSWILIVEQAGLVEDFIREIFNYMVANNTIALFIETEDVTELREILKGRLLH